MAPELSVAIYRPRHGNYQHWALYIQNGKEHHLFEVVGEHPTFERNLIMVNPRNSRSFQRLVFVAMLQHDDIESIRDAAESITVDNETTEWDCQDYVLEMLDYLEEACVLDLNDEDYIEARQELKGKRGAIV